MALVNHDQVEEAGRELAEQLLPLLRSGDGLIEAEIDLVIPARVKADSFWGFRSGASQIPWWRAGGSPCGQGLRFAQTTMRPGFEAWRKRPGMRVKVGVCWRWPRSTTVAPGPGRRGSAASGCRPFGTGLCGSTPAVLKA